MVLTGHNHDLFIQFDGRTLMVESAYDAHYVTVIDLHIEMKQQGNRRERRHGGRNSAWSTPRR